MNESFLLGLVAGLLIATAVARLTTGARPVPGLSRLEGKLDALLKHQGVRFDPYANLAPSVVDALRRGEKIEAIRQYRAVSGVGLKEAKEYIEDIHRQGGFGS